jgi:hypothetical protein
MATTTNYGWTTPDDTALVKDGAAAIRTLGSSVDTTTKNLNPETTLGDIAYRSSTANVKTRLAIGSTGQVLTVAGGVPSWASTPPAGKVLQVVYGSSNTSTTVASTSYTNTTLSATITPTSATSKVLILVSQSFQAERGAASIELGGAIKLLRDTTDIYLASPTGNTSLYLAMVSPASNETWTFSHFQSLNYLDSPATTSATTYKTQGRSLYSSGSGAVRFQDSSNVSTIILMEIGA